MRRLARLLLSWCARRGNVQRLFGMRAETLKLPIPPDELYRACDLSEVGFWSAFEGQYGAAVVLAGTDRNALEAVLALRLAIECFLKHVLCAVRWLQVRKTNLPSGDFLRPSKLGHHLHLLAAWVHTFVEDLDPADMAEFISTLPSDDKWVSDRYRASPAAELNAKRDYTTTKAAFDRMLTAFGVHPS